MITLHGFAASNYYNIVKHVLLYKGLAFEEHLVYGGGEEWLALSPVGKVPALTTAEGEHLSETSAICDYLEEVYPAQPLYPAEPLQRARVRQLIRVAELYLELPSRRLIPWAFSGKTAPPPVAAEVRQVTQRGIEAMRRLCRFSPHLAGADFTLADIYVFYVNSVVSGIGARQLDWDIMAEIPGMKAWLADFCSGEIAAAVEADRRANEPEFTAYIRDYIAARSAPGKGEGDHNSTP